MYHSLLSFDHQLFHFINSGLDNPVFDVLMPILRNKLTWIPVYLLLGFYAIYRYKTNAWKYIAFIAILFFISDFTTFHLLKPFFHRQRPCILPIPGARLLLDSCGGPWGFPSSHAANHMAIAVGIILSGMFRNRMVNCLVLFWALIVGFAQIYVGVHYPFDVAGGFVWGASLAGLLFLAVRKKLQEN